MAMLAEPKRKQKFSFDPRNTNWSNDETKFGHRLMEKMGWSKGKGLGANEDGKTENISVSVKNDTRGVGCSKSHVDNWIAHQDDFNALLANLGQDHGTDDSKQEDTDKKVISLEQKSRTSKGRLHYQKFTKGKDLSLKSETDLDCVFGKRKSQSGTITPQTQSGTNTPQAQSESSSDNEEHSHGFNTVTSTDSVQDYFKKKMAERLNKLKSNEDATKLEDCSNSDDRKETNITSEMDIDSNEVQAKNKRKSKKRKLDSNEINDQDTEILNGRTEDVVNEEEIVKKKKKSKKKKVVTECENETDLNELNAGHIQRDTLEEEKTSKKKSKKKKRNSELTDTIEKDSEDIQTSVTDSVDQSVESQEDVENEVCISEDKPKKKKKSKKRKRETTDTDDIKPKKKVSFMLGDDGNEDIDKDTIEDETTEKNVAKKSSPGKDSGHREEVKTVTQPDISYNLRDTPKTKAKHSTVSVCINVSDKFDRQNSKKTKRKGDLEYSGFTEIGKFNSNVGFNDANTKTCNSETRDVTTVHEVKLVSEAFRGANMSHVKGYSGLRTTSEDVKRKINTKFR